MPQYRSGKATKMKMEATKKDDQRKMQQRKMQRREKQDTKYATTKYATKKCATEKYAIHKRCNTHKCNTHTTLRSLPTSGYDPRKCVRIIHFFKIFSGAGLIKVTALAPCLA